MEVTLPNGRVATYEVIGSGGEPLFTFVGGLGLSPSIRWMMRLQIDRT